MQIGHSPVTCGWYGIVNLCLMPSGFTSLVSMMVVELSPLIWCYHLREPHPHEDLKQSYWVYSSSQKKSNESNHPRLAYLPEFNSFKAVRRVMVVLSNNSSISNDSSSISHQPLHMYGFQLACANCTRPQQPRHAALHCTALQDSPLLGPLETVARLLVMQTPTGSHLHPWESMGRGWSKTTGVWLIC